MAAAIALGGFTGPEADTLGYAIRKKKSTRPAGPEGEVRHPGRRARRRRRRRHRRGLQGVRAVRALRLQQGPRHLLRPDRLPDRVPQGELHGRLHDRASCRPSGSTRRRSPPPSPSAGGWASRSGRRTSTRATVEFTVEGEAIRFGLLAVKNVGPGRDRVDHRGARGRGRAVPVARRLVPPDRPAARATGRCSSRWPRSARCNGVRASGADPRWPRRRDRRGAGDAARPRDRPDVAVRPRRGGRDGPRAAARRRRRRRPSASGCAGRRSCSGCTSPSTRWARSPSRSASSSPRTRATSSDETLDGQRLVVGGIVDRGRGRSSPKRESTMAVVTLEDLQGSIEVVVFPRLYEQTGPIWQRGRDPARRRAGSTIEGEEVSLLADVVVPWDDAVARGRRRSRARWRRGIAAGRRRGPGGWQNGRATATVRRTAPVRRDRLWPSVPARAPRATASRGLAPVPMVSPLRHGAVIAPAARVACADRHRSLPPSRSRPTWTRRAWPPMAPDRDLDPAVPDEARARIVADAAATRPWMPVPRPSCTCGSASTRRSDRVVVAMETFKVLLRDHPGATRVVIHVPRRRAAARCRWSSDAASPTTRSSSRRCVGAWAMASWSCRSSAPDG